MNENEAGEAIRGEAPARRIARQVSWRTIALGAVVVAGLAMVFPQNTLTAPVPDTIEMADMTWVEVRSAIDHGYTVAVVPTGGIEQNGPHMVLGKHDYIVRKAANRIARDVGRTLVTPVVSYVPEGDYEPPSGNFLFPGTLGIPAPVFAQVLEGIARSLKLAGIKTICFIGDHGLNQAPQAEVAAKLNREWAGQGITVLHVAAYYDGKAQVEYLRKKGETPATIGDHAGLIDTAELLAAHPEGVDLARLTAVPMRSEPTGHSGNPERSLAGYGPALLDIRIKAAVQQIKATLAARTVAK